MGPPPPVSVEDRVAALRRPEPEQLRDAFFAAIPGLTLGLVRGDRWRLRVGRLTLLAFDEPVWDGAAWSWPITGGLLAWPPGGRFVLGWGAGELFGRVDGYSPTLARPLYRVTQLPLHHLLSRRFLLFMRGRVPPPGVPAGPGQRLAAAAVDLALCAGVTWLVGPRRRTVTFAAVAIAYHLGFWAGAGRTPGGRVLRLRVAAVDGSRPDPLQAALRLLALPVALWHRRAVHDEVALTEVVEDAVEPCSTIRV